MKRFLAVLAIALLAASCTGGGPNPAPSGTPLSNTAIRLRILDALNGNISFCGPPVVMTPRTVELRQELKSLRRDQSLYRAILEHEHLLGANPTRRDLFNVVRVFQQVEAIELRRAGDVYAFHTYTRGAASEQLVAGIVDLTGAVQVQRRTTASQNCPICLARGVSIASPSGPIPVQEVRLGMTVWSVDREGHRIRAVVLRTRRLPARGELLRIHLEDGRSVTVSSRHPTASGRLVGRLGIGDRFAGSQIRAIAAVPYRGFTFDLLPSGPTGDYVADGVLLGSTLFSRR